MSKYRVLIPDCIIRNEEGIVINSKEFMLYYYLKILHDKQKSLKVKLNHNQYMCKFGIKANSTFKNILNGLHKNKLIHTEIDKLPKSGLIEIEMNEEYIEKKPFTLIHINLYYLIGKIGHEGLRLMYYYESRVNRNKENNQQFCYAGVRTIAKETKINRNKVIDVNEELCKLNILNIDKHDLDTDGTMNEFEQVEYTKYNNHYYPLIDKIVKYQFSK